MLLVWFTMTWERNAIDYFFRNCGIQEYCGILHLWCIFSKIFVLKAAAACFKFSHFTASSSVRKSRTVEALHWHWHKLSSSREVKHAAISIPLILALLVFLLLLWHSLSWSAELMRNLPSWHLNPELNWLMSALCQYLCPTSPNIEGKVFCKGLVIL